MLVIEEDHTLFIYLSAELIAMNIASFLPESAYLKNKDGNFCHVKRSCSNKTTRHHAKQISRDQLVTILELYS